MKKDTCKGNQKKPRISILISDKVFKTKTLIRDREEHYIMIKVSIQEEAITLVNMHPT